MLFMAVCNKVGNDNTCAYVKLICCDLYVARHIPPSNATVCHLIAFC